MGKKGKEKEKADEPVVEGKKGKEKEKADEPVVEEEAEAITPPPKKEKKDGKKKEKKDDKLRETADESGKDTHRDKFGDNVRIKPRHSQMSAQSQQSGDNVRRASNFSGLSGSQGSDVESGEALEEPTVRTWRDFRKLCREFCSISKLRAGCRTCRLCCAVRSKAAGKSIKEAVVSEVKNGVGKTATAKQIGWLQKRGKDALRQDVKEKMDSVSSQLFGMKSDGKETKKKDKSELTAPGGFGAWTFIIHNPGLITDYFEVKGEIGSGGSSQVFLCQERCTKVGRVVKRMPKPDKRAQKSGTVREIGREVTVMKMMDHPNIVKLFETFEDEKFLYLIIELCEGGDLLDRLLERGSFSEFEAAVTIRVILMLLNYLRAQGFVHRDIKPENILFKDSRPDILAANLRIIDFGFAYNVGRIGGVKPGGDDRIMNTKVGSPYYIAPEVLKGVYTEQCDVWSTGVITYLLIAGSPPFIGRTDAETLSLVRAGKYKFPKSTWGSVSRPAKHLIRHMLRTDPAERITARRALDHEWVRGRGVVKFEKLKEETVERLINFHHNHRLRKAAMLAVAYQLDGKDLRYLQELFHCMDSNSDGILTRQEFAAGVQACGIDETSVAEMIYSVDSDASGVIDYSEFLAATLDKAYYIKKHDALLRAFRCFDQDDGGSLSQEEIAQVLDMDTADTREEVSQFFAAVDLNADGKMDYGEFFQMLLTDVGEKDDEGDEEEDDGKGKKSPKKEAAKEAAPGTARGSQMGTPPESGSEQDKKSARKKNAKSKKLRRDTTDQDGKEAKSARSEGEDKEKEEEDPKKGSKQSNQTSSGEEEDNDDEEESDSGSEEEE